MCECLEYDDGSRHLCECCGTHYSQLEREAAAWREVVEVVNKGMKYHATGCAVVMLVETYLRKESGNDKRTGK